MHTGVPSRPCVGRRMCLWLLTQFGRPHFRPAASWGSPIPRSSSVIHLKGARSSQKPHAQFITMTGHIKISPEGGVRGRAQVQAAGCPLPVESCGQRSVLAAVCDKMHGVSSTRATHLGLGIQTFSSGSVMCAELMLPAPPESKKAGGPEPPPEVTLSAQPGCRGPGPR